MGDEEVWESPSARVRPIDWLIIGVDTTRRFMGDIETALANVEHMLVGHANFQAEQAAFADSVRQDIETMIEGDENG